MRSLRLYARPGLLDREMNTKQILEFLQAQIHTVVLATADGQGLPVTCAIDIMDSADGALYFLTAKGKALYARLKACPTVALTGIRGESTMTRVAISLRGRARECGRAVLQRLLEKNPYMYEIYPTARSREGLTAFVSTRAAGNGSISPKSPSNASALRWATPPSGRTGNTMSRMAASAAAHALRYARRTALPCTARLP